MRAERGQQFKRFALVSFLVLASVTAVTPRGASAGQQQPQQSPQPPAGQSPEGARGQTPAATPAAPARASSPAAGPQVQTTIENDKPVIVNADLITLTVTVTDVYGRFVTGLGKNAFTIVDDKEPQEISFFSDEDAPVSLGVIFDVSGSMGGDKISRAREALSRFVETSHNNDEYFLIGFNNRAQLLLDKTRNSDALMEKLTFVETKGNTALYDACYLGVEKVTRGAHQKRAVLLISDGQDNNSRYTFKELNRMLKESDVIIYAVGIVGSNEGSTLDMSGRAILEELAGVSGGKAFFPSTSAEMNDTFERIALELRTQYSIGYRPSNFVNDGKWHKLKIKVQPPRGFPRLFVRGREGYYAQTIPR